MRLWAGAAVLALAVAPAPRASAQGAAAAPHVVIETTKGEIIAVVHLDRAPRTARNFLDYADDGVFDGGTFFRTVRADNQPNDSVKIGVVQGGPDRAMRERLRPPITLERTSATGLSHVDGALSMARSGPDTGRAQFFICIGDQPELDFGGARNPDGQGFAVFGRVLDGMEVVRAIQAGQADGQRLVEPVRIVSVRRATDTRPARAESPTGLRETLQAYIDSLAANSRMPGLTLGVALPDGSSLGLAAGWSDTLTYREMRASDRMLQGSVGKTYFGAVALQLVAEGRLDLDARLADYLGDEPWFDRLPNARDVTIRQLMSHTSGIVRYELNPAFLADLAADPMRTWTPEERVSYLFGMEPPFAAGEGWDYSDTNFILVAMAVEAILGTQIYDEIDARLLGPLGLEHTVRSDRPRVPGISNGYAGPDNPFGDFDATVSVGGLAFNPQFEWAGGGFASTAEDLAVWTRHVQEGRAFDAGLLDEYRSGVPAPLGPRGSYGLGVIMMELPAGTAWGHSGFMPGYRTEAYYFPDGGFAVALQINSSHGAAYDRPPLLFLSEIAALVGAGGRP